jgi:hypothetical protein
VNECVSERVSWRVSAIDVVCVDVIDVMTGR